jgi:hypothetical protein
VRIVLTFIALLLLPGCAQQNVKEALDNLSKDCDRDYSFAASTGGVGGIGGSVMISGTAHCKHEFSAPPASGGTP